MQKIVLILVFGILCMACRPEPSVEDIQASHDAMSKASENLADKEHIAEVRLTVPDGTWSIEIVDVTQAEEEIAVICQLKRSDMMGIQVISEVVDAVKFSAKDLPIKYYIQGKEWNWENTENYIFQDDTGLQRVHQGESLVFERVPPSSYGGPKKHPVSTPQ